MNSIQSLTPQVAKLFAEKARKDENCKVIHDNKGKPIAWKFVQNSNVITLIDISRDKPMGHILRAPAEAQEIRDHLKAVRETI